MNSNTQPDQQQKTQPERRVQSQQQDAGRTAKPQADEPENDSWNDKTSKTSDAKDQYKKDRAH